MWQDDSFSARRTAGRAVRGRRERPLTLNVRTKGAAGARAQSHPLLQWLVFLAMLAAAAGLVWFILFQLYATLFSRNPMFTLNRIEVQTENNAYIRASLVREWLEENETLRIAEGMNLFAADIEAVRTDFLRKIPNIRAMQIERILPDRLRIEIRERTPVAFLSQRRGDDLFLDDQGFAFVAPGSKRVGLPTIVEYTGEEMRPGHRAAGLLRDAIVAVGAFRRVFPVSERRIERLSVRGRRQGRSDALRLILSNGTEVDLWWIRAENDVWLPSSDLERRMAHLALVLRKADKEGIRLKTVNLALDNFAANSPVVVHE